MSSTVRDWISLWDGLDLDERRLLKAREVRGGLMTAGTLANIGAK